MVTAFSLLCIFVVMYIIYFFFFGGWKNVARKIDRKLEKTTNKITDAQNDFTNNHPVASCCLFAPFEIIINLIEILFDAIF